jgi:hypothetical protein
MATPLSSTEVAYNIVQKTLANPNMSPPQELYPVLKPIWAQIYISTTDPLDLVFVIGLTGKCGHKQITLDSTGN